jgi:hypothetical protein
MESRDGSFEEEYRGAVPGEVEMVAAPLADSIPSVVQAPSGDVPFAPVLSPQQSWETNLHTEGKALQAIQEWIPSVLESEPGTGAYDDLPWNREWLKRAMIVFDDPRSFWRLKAYAALHKEITRMEDLLEVGIRFGMSFALYIKRGDVRLFSDPTVSPLVLNTLAALYEPGFVDLPLIWGGPGGNAGQYVQYEGNLNNLLARPEAVAFVPMGGVPRYVAELYDETIVRRYVRGPSYQVSQFDKGAAFLYSRGGEEVFYTTDSVSNSEVNILLGTIPGAHPGNQTTLWPTPEVFESECEHMRGYLSEGALAILDYIRRDILEFHKYRWRTRSQWKEYFRVGCKKVYQAQIVPKSKDFKVGEELFARSYPVLWPDMEIADITLPEIFNPHSPRD